MKRGTLPELGLPASTGVPASETVAVPPPLAVEDPPPVPLGEEMFPSMPAQPVVSARIHHTERVDMPEGHRKSNAN